MDKDEACALINTPRGQRDPEISVGFNEYRGFRSPTARAPRGHHGAARSSARGLLRQRGEGADYLGPLGNEKCAANTGDVGLTSEVPLSVERGEGWPMGPTGQTHVQQVESARGGD